MDVQLEILQGRLKQSKTDAGVNRFNIRTRRFVIGSDASCHMVCKSRTISDRHCLILVTDDGVSVRDLDSHAGTFINDVPVEGTQPIGNGDKLRIGRLEFRLLLEDQRSPPVAPVARPTATPNESDEQAIDTVVGSETVDALVSELLELGDEVAREERYADPSARYFRADQLPSDERSTTEPEERPTTSRPKKPVGKLPAPPPIQADNTVSAAEQALEELFHAKKPAKG